MAFEIGYSRLAHSQLKSIRAFDRTAILNQIDSDALLYCQEQYDDSPDGDESDDTNR